ncbi:hypothetical protein KEM48_007747 [Puccinia striiformis f. sp. tritici PST-130]|nr:hypothetical protein KEM48_007747 [Puccinia striiformis f. sp. tritici PST-130]
MWDESQDTELEKRSRKYNNLFLLLRRRNSKYDFPPPPGGTVEKSANLTIEDMAEKGEVLEKLASNLLPSIKGHIITLVTALYQQDLEQEHASLDLELIQETLSNLDQSLPSTVSSTILLAHDLPLPDEKHDHHLKKLKSFRCSQLYLRVKFMIEIRINSLLNSWMRLMQSCAMATLSFADNPVGSWADVARDKGEVYTVTARTLDVVENTIAWSRKSDWAIIQEDWLSGAETCEELLHHLNKLADPSFDLTPDLARLNINLTEEGDPAEHTIVQNRRKATKSLMIEVAESTKLLVILFRLLPKKLLAMIPKKPTFELETTINSETLRQLQEALQTITWLIGTFLRGLRFLPRRDYVITVPHRDRFCDLVNELKTTMKSSSAILASQFLPLLDDTVSSEHEYFKDWSLTLERSWDEVVDRLLILTSSFDAEPEPLHPE